MGFTIQETAHVSYNNTTANIIIPNGFKKTPNITAEMPGNFCRFCFHWTNREIDYLLSADKRCHLSNDVAEDIFASDDACNKKFI